MVSRNDDDFLFIAKKYFPAEKSRSGCTRAVDDLTE
jgi:hypothetical protein